MPVLLLFVLSSVYGQQLQWILRTINYTPVVNCDLIARSQHMSSMIDKSVCDSFIKIVWSLWGEKWFSLNTLNV